MGTHGFWNPYLTSPVTPPACSRCLSEPRWSLSIRLLSISEITSLRLFRTNDGRGSRFGPIYFRSLCSLGYVHMAHVIWRPLQRLQQRRPGTMPSGQSSKVRSFFSVFSFACFHFLPLSLFPIFLWGFPADIVLVSMTNLSKNTLHTVEFVILVCTLVITPLTPRKTIMHSRSLFQL